MRNAIVAVVFAAACATRALAQWTDSGGHIFNDNTGNVGIGTMQPATMLHVVGPGDDAIRADGTATVTKGIGASGPGLVVSRSRRAPGFGVPFTLRTEIDGNSIDAYSSLFEGSGPLLLNSTSGGAVHLANGGGDVHLANGGGDVHLATGGGDVYMVMGGGSVGVGTDQPTARLEVRSSESSAVFRAVAEGSGQWADAGVFASPNAEGGSALTVIGASDRKPAMKVSGSGNQPALHVWHNGDDNAVEIQTFTGVWIGSVGEPSPLLPSGVKLGVVGKIMAEEVEIQAQEDWPDYVFDEGYELMQLADLEEVIRHHGHLPDVPSAEEVKEKGVELGQMQALLLRKVEELTLYLIDLDKQLDALRRENEQLRPRHRSGDDHRPRRGL